MEQMKEFIAKASEVNDFIIHMLDTNIRSGKSTWKVPSQHYFIILSFDEDSALIEIGHAYERRESEYIRVSLTDLLT